MNILNDYVNWKLANADKVAEAEGYPLVMENCKKNKKMKELKVWGHNLIRDNRSASRDSATFIISGSKLTLNGSNTSNIGMEYISKYSTTLKANVKYTFSIHYISGEFVSGKNGIVIGLHNSSNKWVVSPTRYVDTYQNTYTESITVEEDTSVSFSIVGWGEFNNLVFGIQLVEGDAVGEYKEYVGEKTENLLDTDNLTYAVGINNFKSSTLHLTETGISFAKHTTSNIAHVLLDLGLADAYSDKTLTCAYDVSRVGSETYINTRFVICDADYSNRSEIGVHMIKDGTSRTTTGGYCSATFGSGYGDKKLLLRLYVSDCVVGEDSTFEFNNLMLTESDTPMAFEPYGKYKIPIVQGGKNLVSMSDHTFSSAYLISNDEYSVTYKGAISQATSQWAASLGWAIFGGKNKAIVLLKNSTITISLDITPLEKHDDSRETATKIIARYPDNNAQCYYVASPIYNLELGTKYHISYTFTPRGNFGRLIEPIVYLCSHTMKIENFQVEYGDTETIYKPFVEPQIHNVYLDEPLSGTEYIDFKQKKVFRADESTEDIECTLPTLNAKTTVFTTDTIVQPSNMYGKYIKK